MKNNFYLTLFLLFMTSHTICKSTNFFESNLFFMELYPGKDPLGILEYPNFHRMKLKTVILDKGSLYFTNPLDSSKIEGSE